MDRRTVIGSTLAAGVASTALGTTAARADAPDRPTTPIVITEQAAHEIVVMDPGGDWASPSARLWSWKPGPDSDINAPASAWLHPDDARLRTDPRTGEQYVLVTDSYGLVAQVPYPDAGPVAWSIEESNAHGAELLPDGNIAVAATGAGEVKVYTASQGRTSQTYASVPLESVHEVLWDEPAQLLWALGKYELVTIAVDGDPAAPELTVVDRHELPTVIGGHDLQPVSGDDDRLWVTTNYALLQFIKSTGKFTTRHPRYREMYSPQIKSIATDIESGAVLQTVVKPDNPSPHCTDTVELYVGDDTHLYLTLPGSQIYRARWFDERSN